MILDTTVIIGVVVINAIVGFLQKGKAERALEAVANMLSPTAAVLRDGSRSTIPAEELVPRDVVILESGDRVPADIRLLDATRLQIDEAMLTGESVPATKSAEPLAADALLADRRNMGYSGTFVTGGQASGVVVATGGDTELGRINAMLTEVQTLVTPLTRQLDQFGRWLTVAILVLAALTFGFGAMTPDTPGHGLVELFMATVGLAVAAIPEGLPAIVTITLAIGVQRMARRNAIIRLPDSSLAAKRMVEEIARAGLLCSDAEIKSSDDGWRAEGDPTAGALVTLVARTGHDAQSTRSASPRRATIPFDPAYRYMATLHEVGVDGLIVVKGAPETLLPRCAKVRRGDTDVALNASQWTAAVERLAADGMRTLAIAIRQSPWTSALLEHDQIDDGLTLLGVVGIIDPPRDEAIEASRTAAVNALVMGQIFYLLSVRHDLSAAWTRSSLLGNVWVYAAIAAVIVLQLLFTYWGAMNTLFGTAATDRLAWAWALMVGLLVLFAVESEKAWRRRDASQSGRRSGTVIAQRQH